MNNHKSVRLTLLFGLILITLSSQACTREEEKRYELAGKVVAVDLRGKTVTISHEEIKGYMEPMTMPFRVLGKDEFYLDKMNAGDRVQATLVVAGSRSWIENLIVTQESREALPPTAQVTEPQPGEQIPDFTLINQDGKKISINQYKGKALLLTFIYTRCPLPDYCPLMTSNFAEINKAITSQPELQKRAHLMSITVDPEYDKPAVLRAYGVQHNPNQSFENWEYATGSSDEIKKIASHFGLYYSTQEDQIVHNLQTALIAPDGKFVKIYRGNEWKPADVVSDLQKLAKE
ncbi:MAG: SCO family protein [Acidobacteriota bacterium]